MKEKNANRVVLAVTVIIAIILLAIGIVYNMTCGETIFDGLDRMNQQQTNK